MDAQPPPPVVLPPPAVPAARAGEGAANPAAAVVPGVDDVVYWAKYQVRTMDDGTFTLLVAGLIVVMGLAMTGLRPKR